MPQLLYTGKVAVDVIFAAQTEADAKDVLEAIGDEIRHQVDTTSAQNQVVGHKIEASGKPKPFHAVRETMENVTRQLSLFTPSPAPQPASSEG